jgi:UDP-N-acetylglucosamine 2-epimerase
MKLLCIAGARPNFMKVAPLMEAFRRHPGIKAKLVHTGQHYDQTMSGLFFRQLGIPEPDVNLGVGGGTHAVQTAAIMQAFEPVVLKEKPEAVLVVESRRMRVKRRQQRTAAGSRMTDDSKRGLNRRTQRTRRAAHSRP